MEGFYGRILKVDLTEKKYHIIQLKDEIYNRFSGGKGLASYLLYMLNPPEVDPFSPGNCLIFATGPVSGSTIWGSSRYGVFTKSPQTLLYSESYSGGRTPEAINATGFDAIVITGKSHAPLVLEIIPEETRFHEAGNIWGMDSYEAEDRVIKKFGSSDKPKMKSGAVVIGPAGERRVRFAVIENDYWRSAGRTGVGAVMGSKNLKAIVFKGDRKRSLFDKEQIKTFTKELAVQSKSNPVIRRFKSYGTPNMVTAINKAGAFPNRYWADTYLDGWEKISTDALHNQCDVKPRACSKCFIACSRMTTIKNGRHAGLKLEGPEYETIFAFGGLCLVDEIEEIAYLNDICDRLGLDTISSGNLCAFTIEAVKRNAIQYEIDYGDVDAIAVLLKMIARREGIGDTLAKGIRFAAAEWGLEDLAVHVKGLEPPGYDPRVLKGCGLAFATSCRGACHLRATFHTPELTGLIAPGAVKGKARLFTDFEDRLTLFDCMILCKFYRGIYNWNNLSRTFKMTTGLEEDEDALRRKAADISSLVRAFNIREGLKPEDDNLPKRLYKEPPRGGNGIQEAELKTMIKDYYELRGWDENGVPPDLDLPELETD